MNCLISLFNHNKLGQRSLEDVIGIFGNQLRALGHEALWFPDNTQFVNQTHGINIIVEGFTEFSIDVIKNAYELGCRFICLATEEPTPHGFNHGRDREMVKRQQLFPKVAQYLEGILCLVPGEHVTRWYGQWAPTAYIELGYADSLIRRMDIEPVFDFGFFGSISKRREKILKRLARYIGSEKAIRICSDFPEQAERDQIMRQARVILQIRKYDEMGLVSSSRCNTSLCVGRPIIAEPHALSKPWDEIVWFSKTMESFYAGSRHGTNHVAANSSIAIGEIQGKTSTDVMRRRGIGKDRIFADRNPSCAGIHSAHRCATNGNRQMIVRFPMPNDLRQMELKVQNGADPDSIKGIERLWMYRMMMRIDEFAEEERKFIAWLKTENKL